MRYRFAPEREIPVLKFGTSRSFPRHVLVSLTPDGVRTCGDGQRCRPSHLQ